VDSVAGWVVNAGARKGICFLRDHCVNQSATGAGNEAHTTTA
jgi:hypothetical protein